MGSLRAHRDTDPRVCAAATVVTLQNNVFVNEKLWAVKGDPNNHGDGALINTSGSTVWINGINVIVHGPDHAVPDTLCFIIGPPHCDPMTASGSDNVFAYGGDSSSVPDLPQEFGQLPIPTAAESGGGA